MVKETKRNRVIRVPDSLWNEAREHADANGETVSEAVRKFLERYCAWSDLDRPGRV